MEAKTISALLAGLVASLVACKGPRQQHLDWVNLQCYAQDNARLGPPAPGEKRVVFMGNSITSGWMKADSAFFAGRPYINRGISGQTTPQMLLRFRADVLALRPAVVMILAGINDIAQNAGVIPLEVTAGNIFSMAELARAQGIRPVIGSVLPALAFPWRPGLQPAPQVQRLNAMLKAYCDQQRITYVDYYSKMADAAQGLDARYTDDGVHPTLAGYRVMEPLAEAAIRACLADTVAARL